MLERVIKKIEKECVIMTKTELRSATSAANKIIKLTSKARKDYAGGFYDKQGRQIIISDYIAIRLNEHLSIPEVSIPPNAKDDEPQRYKGRGHESIVYDFGERLPMVNSEYMLLIYKVLGWQNLTAKINEDKWETSPIYFFSDRGDGILMPISKKRSA